MYKNVCVILTPIAQVVVGCHYVVAGFLNAKYRHVITSLRRSGKEIVFVEKTVSTPPGCLGGETAMGGGILADCGRTKHGIFDTLQDSFKIGDRMQYAPRNKNVIC